MNSMRLIMYCGWNKDSLAIKTINEDPNIDLMELEGIVFWHAIKNHNISILRSLLEYYERNQLKGDSNSMEYKTAKFKLHQVLEYIVDNLNPSEDILEVLEKYLPQEDSSFEQDLSGFNSPPEFENETFQPEMEKIRTLNAILSKESN